MSYGTPQPGDDAQLRAWRRRYAEDTERGFSLRLPLALARRLRAEAARGVPHSRYAADLLRAALGDLPGGPALAAVPPPTAGAPGAPDAPDAPDAPPPNARGQVDLRTLRVIQLREGRAGTPPARHRRARHRAPRPARRPRLAGGQRPPRAQGGIRA